jgi:hypothetical protein
MDFLKHHYEKVLLGVVLLLLTVVAGYLPFEVASVRSGLDAITDQIGNPKVKPLDPLNLATNVAVVDRLEKDIEFGFGTGVHGLFNPSGTWRKPPQGFPPIPPAPAGVEGLAVTKITPLMLQVEYQGPSQGSGTTSPRYRFYFKNEASTNRADMRGRIIIHGPGARPDAFIVKDMLGPKEERETVTVSKEKPYSEVAGFAADLRHEAEGRNYLRQRPGSKLAIAGTAYNIVAVSEADVTIEDDKTKRRTVVPLKSAP